jgi:16S rRNA (uracil1498-N3)-methyltransferase
MSYFLSNQVLSANQSYQLDDGEARHILLSRRVKIGEQIKLQGPDQQRFLAEVLQADKKSITVKIRKQLPTPQEPPLQIHLFQALVAEQALDVILQKSTELGAHSIWLFNAANSPAHLLDKSDQKLARWTKILWEAAKQSERVKIPELYFLKNLDEAIKQGSGLDTNILLHPDATTNFSNLKTEGYHVKTFGLFIGPEGGFTDTEVNQISKLTNTELLKFGPRILRAETAAMAGIATVQSLFGDC